MARKPTLILLIPFICLTAPACYKQEIESIDQREAACWVNIRSSAIPTIDRIMDTLAQTGSPVIEGCDSPPYLRYFLADSRRPMLEVRRERKEIGDPLLIFFYGKDLPRDRWSEGETWGDKFCDLKEVACVTRVTGKGEVLFDAVWNDRTPPMGH
jgi:hypothetical protein